MDYKLLYLNYDAEIHVHSNKFTYYYQYKNTFKSSIATVLYTGKMVSK